MDVQSYGEGVQFSQLKPGDCFLFSIHNKNEFGISIRSENKTMLIFIFDKPGGHQVPRVTSDGYPYQLLRILSPILRPDPKSLHFNSPTIGELISGGGKFYLKGCDARTREEWTANLKEGVRETIPEGLLVVSYSRWSVGHILDGVWISIFDFDSAVNRG